MPRSNTTAEADATGMKRCSVCRKWKHASRNPNESSFYVNRRKRKDGSFRTYYASACNTCSTMRCTRIRLGHDNKYGRKYYREIREDPERWEAYREYKKTYDRRNRIARRKCRKRWGESALGRLCCARSSNKRRLADATAACNISRAIRLTELIGQQDAEIARLRSRRKAEKARDADPRLYNRKTFKKLLNSIHDPSDEHKRQTKVH